MSVRAKRVLTPQCAPFRFRKHSFQSPSCLRQKYSRCIHNHQRKEKGTVRVCVRVCACACVCVCARSQLKCCAEAVTRFAPLLPGSFSLTDVLHCLLFRLPCFEQRHACWVCPVAEAEPDAAARCPLPTEHRHKRPSGKACACHAKANLCVHRPARQRAGRAWKGVRGGANI